MARRPMRRVGLCLFLIIVVGLGGSQGASGGQRGLLWRVVQSCLLNHRVTGGSFPCLSVQTANGLDAGYAVLRPLNEDTHVIVTPTVRTIGIEALRLRGAGAPNYFQDAWLSRHFVTDDLAKKPGRADLAFAVNSKPGRSQDQLHIHAACLRAEVKTVLTDQAKTIRTHDWARVKVLPGAPHYWVHFEASRDLSGVNVFDRVAAGLNVEADQMDNVTIVVVGAAPDGFVILARTKLPHGSDEPHGEALLDHECSAFARP